MRRKLKIALLTLVAILLAAQVYQPARVNPPSDPSVSFEAVANPSPQVRSIIQRSCQDCHSNHTVWPWYSRVAPASWLVASDVSEAREDLNLSEWGKMTPERRLKALRDICREAKSGDMPMWQYKLMHPAARLQPADVTALCLISSGGN